MGIKIIKLVAACSLLIFLSSCGVDSSTPAAAAVDNSLTVSSINEQATLKNVAKTVTLTATDSSYTQAIEFQVTSSNVNVTPSVSDSTLTLTPATAFTGTSTITVKAFDGTLYSAAQTFTFTVCDSACAPVLNVVTADATVINTAKNITLAGTDANSDSLTYSATSSTSNVVPSISGTTLTLTPATGWTGTATISTRASDASLDSAVKTFTFKVCATACLPTLASVSSQTTTEDTTKAITLVGADPESDALTYTATSSTTNVTTTISGSTLTLNPKLNWSGSATITAKVTDGDDLSATRTFTLTTSAVNDTPVLTSISDQTTAEDTAKIVTLSGSDVEGDSLTYSATSDESNVTPSISGATLTLTPAANWSGTATISAKVNDGTIDSATKTFTLTVSAVNDVPVVGTVADQTTNEDTAKAVTLSETDVDTGDSHTFSATSAESEVTPSISGTTLTLTPDANWSGTSVITIKANDGTVDSATKTFTLSVSAVNDAPVVGTVADQTTNEDTAKAVTLSGSDVEGSTMTYSATSSITTVTPSISGTTLTLTPDANWYGTSVITIKANDGTVDSATKTFTLTVNQVDDTRPLLLIRLIFNNAPFNAFQSNEASWANKIFGSSDGQLNDWFAENSNDGFLVTEATETSGTSNNGVVTATIDMAHPGDTNFTANNHAVIKAAITAIDGSVNFAAYDTNSNGGISYDELQIMFIVAGGETATGHDDAGSIWAHKWQVNDSPPTHDGVSLMNWDYGGNYSAFGERQGGNSRDHDATIGVIAHELGHSVFLITDLYDSDSSTAGIGKFGIMGGGSWGYKPGDNYAGQTPSHMTAYSKIKAGFIAPTKITADGTYTANDIANDIPNVFKIESGTSNEYFLLQNRNAVGYDRALNNLNGTGTFAGGLLITHVSENVSVNSNEAHRLVDVEEANDAQNDGGTTPGNYGHYNGLFFSGNQSSFTDSTSPNTKRISGSASNVSITSIGSQSAAMNFTVDVP